NRVDSAKLAVERAGAECAAGAVGASDAFFPFPDGLQILIDAGVTAVVQPGGSIRDDEVIAAAQQAGITMYLTGRRHFFRGDEATSPSPRTAGERADRHAVDLLEAQVRASHPP